MSPPTRPRVRAKRPKVRTGCRTCKIRKVKCDERKPTCARCANYGAVCEGYEIWSSDRPSKDKACDRQLLPLPLMGTSPSSTAVFQDDRQYSYFRHFQDETALDISSHFDQSLLNHVIIQCSWTEPSLRQLVASLGALHIAENPRASCQNHKQGNSHRHYALQQYGQALTNVQIRISASKQRGTTRVALVASLLIFFFENLYGDMTLALRHLENALQLMRTELTSFRRRYRHSRSLSPTPDIDGDLIAAFCRLDGGLMSRADISGQYTGSRLGLEHIEAVQDVPAIFNSITEARSYLENIQFVAVPCICQYFSKDNGLPAPPGDMDPDSRRLCTDFCSQMERWHTAYAPFYTESMALMGSKISIAAATLQVRAVSTELAARRLLAEDQESIEAFDERFKEVVSLARYIADDPGFLKSFVLDCGIVPGLAIVVFGCTNMEIRREALEILKSIVPRREGAWDSVTVVEFGEAILGISGND